MDKFNTYVICLDTNIVYQGVREAEKFTGCDNSNISKVCRGTRKSVNGLHFAYFDPLIHTDYTYADRSVLYDRSVCIFPTTHD